MRVVRPATFLFLSLAASGILAAQGPNASQPTLAQRIAARLRPNDLKADVSFLASDALQGRATPSPGLDMAAEYIAAQFRRAGLEPVGDDGYFQTANYLSVKPNSEGLQFSFGAAKAADGAISLQEGVATDLQNAPAFKVSVADASALDALTADQVRGKVLLVETSQAGGAAGFQAQRRLLTLAAKLEPAMVVIVRATAAPGGASARPQLRDAALPAPKFPVLTIGDKAVFELLAAAKPGTLDATVSAHIAAPLLQPVKIRNVAGLLRGSDPQLKDTLVIVTGHYDHLGVRPNASPDSIYNGANDDASGTSSVIEIANAITAIGEKPRRSILFMTVFGEEIGGYGARWYTSHPIFPIAKTIADINLEHLGRTDDLEGPNVGKFNLTGFDYTDIAATFAKAGAETGVKVVKHPIKSDSFFSRSDNATFADAGIPSTTLSVSYEFPDYHQPGDEWQKLDYDNLAKVDTTVALGILAIANSDRAPQWNKDNPKAARYIK
jgi:hypothetical protein